MLKTYLVGISEKRGYKVEKNIVFSFHFRNLK